MIYLYMVNRVELKKDSFDLAYVPRLKHPARYWDDKETRRKYLFSFAEKKGFDPMILANWKGKAAHLQVGEVNIYIIIRKDN